MPDPLSSNSVNGAAPNKRVTVRSTIGNPYFNLSDSLEVAKIVHEKAGGTCTPEQLVGLLGYKSKHSGTFQMRYSSARQFGFIQVDNGVISVTERAHKILSPVMPEESLIAKAEAFLSVELFKVVYDQFHGASLPPEDGLRNLLRQRFGFSEDRAGPAVKVLMASAEQAGFFSIAGRTKLIYPAIAKKSAIPDAKPLHVKVDLEDPEVTEKPKQAANLPDAPSTVHSAIIGLLRDLPAPGTVWPQKQKKRFIRAFQATLDFVYQSDEDEDDEARE